MTGRPNSRSSSSIPGLPVAMPISMRPSVSTDGECASQAKFRDVRSGEAHIHAPTRRSARVAATARVGPGATATAERRASGVSRNGCRNTEHLVSPRGQISCELATGG